MEAYKELFRHKRNEEKRHEAISCFQAVWTEANIFGRLHGDKIRWNVTPHPLFLPKEHGSWLVPPIRINRLSQSPDPEANFVAHPDFGARIDDFLNDIATHWRPPDQERSDISPDRGAQPADTQLPHRSPVERPTRLSPTTTESAQNQQRQQAGTRVKSRNKRKCTRKH